MKETWLKGKEWWTNLAVREKQAVVLGSIVLGIYIVYQWIWTPYLDAVDQLRKRILTNQVLVQWMQTADTEIRQIELQMKDKPKAASPVVFLGWMQNQVNEAGLNDSLKQLKQAGNDTIEMHFQAVEFDKLIRLYISVVKKQNAAISQMAVIAGDTPGIVNADVMLKLGR